MANFGFTNITMNGRTAPAIIKLGAKVLDDIMQGIEKNINDLKTSINNVADGGTKRIVVTDVETLTAKQLTALRCGDVVIKQTGTEQHAYTVAYKDDTKHEIALVYADAWNVEEVYYDKSVGNAWSMIEKKITAIATPSE